MNEENDGKLETKLSESGLETMVYIRSRLDVKYDETQREHDMLKILWKSCFDEDGVEFPSSIKVFFFFFFFSHIRTTTTTAFGTRERKVERHGMARHAPFDGFTRLRRFRFRKFSLLLANEERSVQSSRGEEKRKRSDWEYPLAAAGVNVTHELTKSLDVDGIIRNGSVDETLRVDKCVVGFLELVRRRRTTSSSKNNTITIVALMAEVVFVGKKLSSPLSTSCTATRLKS